MPHGSLQRKGGPSDQSWQKSVGGGQPLSTAEAPWVEGKIRCKDVTVWLREAGSFQKLEKKVRDRMCHLEQNHLRRGSPRKSTGGNKNHPEGSGTRDRGETESGLGVQTPFFAGHGFVCPQENQTVDQSEGPPGGHCDLKPREALAWSALLEKFCLTRDRKEVEVCAGCWGTRRQQEGEGSQGWISGSISELEHGVRGCRESRVL